MSIKEENMYKKRILNRLLNAILVMCAFLFLATSSWADHWASSVVPPYGEEALTWCGPATAQMIMEGYPAGGCSESQTNIWSSISTHKVETMWDTDPAGLKGAMLDLCPPAGTWAIHHNTDPAVVMHSAAKWMTRNSYPVAVLLDTSSHNSYTSHQERWAAIQSIKTDLDPTTHTTVNLLTVVIVDPAVPFTTTPSATWISGSDWYSTEFQSVDPLSKPGSSYINEYVAIIEPPEVKGRALAPLEVLTGRLIPRKDVIRYVFKGLKEEGLYEMDAFSALKEFKPIEPFLVNGDFGGYFLIPFTKDGEDGPADAAVLINAYTGSLKQVKVFSEPLKFLTKNKALEIALKHLKEKPETARAELVYQQGQSENKFSPFWQVIANKKTVGVDREGKIITRIIREEHSLHLPGPAAQGIAWDGKQILVVDGETKKLYKLDPYTGRVFQSFNLKLKKPKGLTFDGELLWLADEGTRKIHSVDPNSGQIIKTIEMDIPKEKGFKSLEDLTWDGKYLWTAYFAGFSSTFNQIDPESGKIIRSVFADCHPRGIASNGEYIWSICYNGEKLPSKIDRRKILGKDHEMMSSRTFIKDIEVRDPNGLEYAENNLWYIDKKLKKVFRLRVMKEKK
jgi:hypothetical protein